MSERKLVFIVDSFVGRVTMCRRVLTRVGKRIYAQTDNPQYCKERRLGYDMFFCKEEALMVAEELLASVRIPAAASSLVDAQRKLEEHRSALAEYSKSLKDMDDALEEYLRADMRGCSQLIGTGECAYNIVLPYYVRACGNEQVAPEHKTVSIDKCLLREVLDLWEAGIRTHSVCCGHGNAAIKHIIVSDADAQKMRDLGYERQTAMPGHTEAYFIPKTLITYKNDVRKGFDWWRERLE